MHSESRCSSLDIKVKPNDQSFFNYVNDDHYNKSRVIYEINSKLESYTESVNKKLDSVVAEISVIKGNKENRAYAISVLEEGLNEIKKEKHELKVAPYSDGTVKYRSEPGASIFYAKQFFKKYENQFCICKQRSYKTKIT